MPIFEYNCTECENVFEELVLSSKTTEIRCPRCGSVKTNKMFSTFAAGDMRSAGHTVSAAPRPGPFT